MNYNGHMNLLLRWPLYNIEVLLSVRQSSIPLLVAAGALTKVQEQCSNT